MKKIFSVIILLFMFLQNINFVFATQIDFDKILNWSSTIKQQLNPKKIIKKKQIKQQNTQNESRLNLITTFNEWFVKKYIQDRKQIIEEQKKIEELKKLSEQERQKRLMQYWLLLKIYSKIEKNIDNADYILLVKFNINWLNYFNYKGEKYIFYIKPFIFHNLSKNKKYQWLDKQIKQDLKQLLNINDLVQLKQAIIKIQDKYHLKDFYQIIPLNQISKFFNFKIWWLSQEKFQINLENMKYYNSLYYIPNRLKNNIWQDYIYFYFPVSKKFIEDIVDRNIDEIDFNKFYCVWLKYLDNFYTIDKTICNFKEKSINKIITINFNNVEILKKLDLNIVDRWKEILDIIIILLWPIFAYLIYLFLRYLKTERHQHEQDTL